MRRASSALFKGGGACRLEAKVADPRENALLGRSEKALAESLVVRVSVEGRMEPSDVAVFGAVFGEGVPPAARSGDFGGAWLVGLLLMLLRLGVVGAVWSPFPDNFAFSDLGGGLAISASVLAVVFYWAAAASDP